MNGNLYTVDGEGMEVEDEYDSEATLDISIDVSGASNQQLWMFAEMAKMFEENYKTLVENQLDNGIYEGEVNAPTPDPMAKARYWMKVAWFREYGEEVMTLE